MRNGYRLNSGNKDTKYVQVLNILLYAMIFKDSGINKSNVHKIMKWSTNNGNRSAMWAELSRIGYTKYNPKSRAWDITRKGMNYLCDNNLLICYNHICEVLPNVEYFKQIVENQ